MDHIESKQFRTLFGVGGSGEATLIGVRELATGTAYVKSVRMCVRVWVLRCGSGGPLGN